MVLTKAFTALRRNDKESALSVLLERRDKPESLLFESGVVAELAPWETETIKKEYTKVCDAYGCLGVLRLSMREDDSYMYLVLVTSCRSIGKINNSEMSCINSTVFLPLGNYDDACILEVQKLLNSGSFYFTTLSEKTNDSETLLDLSLTYQRQCTADEPDNRFFWNHSLHVHLQKFGVNCSHWLLNAMCGGIEVKTVYAGAKQAKAMVISRLSCERAGTRFNVRGVNDDGHVANFVETEQIIVLDDCVSSFVQTRGSVPVFWEQPGVQVGSHKVKLSRGFEASAPAFSRHISSLKMIYGDQIMINLLGRKEGESYLSKSYQDHLKASEHCHNTPLFLFDYHLLCKGGKKDKLEILRKKIDPYLNAFGFFVRKGDEIISQQSGTLRTNCVDCLDRTNALQSYIGLEVLPQQLSHLGLAEKTSLVSRFLECFKTMWASNGHLVSRTYTGTGSMEGGARFGSKLHDGAVSVRRTIRNNFFDGSKQEAIDILLLGNTFVSELGDRARALLQNKFLHASPLILRELCDRHLEYTKWRSVRVCVGTFNVNGGHHFRSIAYKHQSLDDWLLDFHLRQPAGVVQSGTDFAIPTDIFAIGFEELVDLKAGNIISTNAAQRLDWGNELKKVISRDNSYVLLTSEQLVGVCLYVFVRADMVHDIRDVAVDSVKTGLGGSAGNKGGVAIRFLLHSSSLCFICSHFAAGQSNIADRNNDYHDIVNKVEFPMGRTVIPHDYVFWCGDFNYRIDLPMDVVKGAIKQEDWDELQAQDQLTKNRKENKCFRGFSEGRLSFAPTYKYDPFSDDYDTSEKMRVPAWTDRVLWRRRHPRSKHVTSLVGTEDLLVDVGDGGVLAEDSSDSEDEEDGGQNGIVEETTRIPDRRKSYRIRQDIANWSAGKLLYYHSAQLKTSDHRPVIALIEIEIQSLDREKEASVHDDVITAMGPADPTVVVSSVTEGEEINSEALLSAFENIGSVVLVRVIDEEFLITFDDGRSALTALSLNDTEIDSVQINVKLKSESLLSNTDITVGNLVEGGASHFVQAPSADPDRPRTLSGRPRTLSDLLDSSEQASTHTTLEPFIIHSVEGASDDDLDDDDDAESSEESEHGGNGNYSRATMISPPPRPKPPPPFKPKKPANPNRNAHPSSPNALKPLRPDRIKDNFGEEGTVDSHAAIEDQDRLKVGESELRKSPIEKRKLAPSRPDRPASSGGKSPTAEEQLKPQVPHRKVESKSPARRPGRPPPPKAGPEKPPPPSLKKPVTSPPPFVAKPPSERAESEDTSTTTTTTNSHHGRSSPTLPTPVTKPEHHMAESTKVKDNSAMSLRKRLGTLKIARKQKEPRPPSTLSIGTPFDVKHVGHVGADNVQSLLVTTSPIDIVGESTGAHASSADDGESPPTTTPLHGLDRPVDDLPRREDDAVVHRKAPVAPKRDPVVPKRNPVVPPREPPVPTRKPEHVPVATDEQTGSGSLDPEVPKMDPEVPNRDPVVAPREPPVPARKPEHVQIVHGKEPTSLGAVPQTDHRVPKMDPDVLKKAPVLPKRDPVVPPRDPLVPGPKHGPVAPPRHHGAVTMDTAVSIERTSPMNSHPVAAPRRRSGNEDHAQTEPANTSTFNPAVFADRVPPQLPPRVPRPDQADNELDTEPGLSSELTVHGPPQVPPRFDLNDDDSDDFPVPPPRRKGRR